jgi:hypothetical protein
MMITKLSALYFLDPHEQLIDTLPHQIALLLHQHLTTSRYVIDKEGPLASLVLLCQLEYLQALCQVFNRVLLL